VECTDVLIENVSVTGIADAAIYVGQSRGPIIVRNNTVFGNVTGIEIENSVGAEVYDNHVYNNAGGILVFVLPNNPSRVGLNTRVYNNLVEENNHINFGAPGSTVSDVPSGTGMMIVAADYTEMFNNTIRNNKTAGIIVTSLYQIYDRDTEFDLGPLPEHNWIHDNFYENNGYAIDESVKDEGFPGSDIIWTTEGWSNSFDEPDASKFPPILPGRNWSDPARRALWRTYDIMVRLMG
jgi:parallel beta-helix repeat protein